MSESGQARGSAIALGVIGLLLIGGGIAVQLLNDANESPVASGVMIRTGAILGAIALVLPSIKRPSASVTAIAGAGLIIVLARPSLIWLVLIVWVGWLVAGRQRSTSRSES